MIFKLFFVFILVWILLRLVQRERLSLDLASLTMVLIVCVLALSFSPFLVEKIAAILEFSNPGMSVVALVLVGLIALCMILAVNISDLRHRQALLVRQLAQLQARQPQAVPPTGDQATSKQSAFLPHENT